MQLPENFSLRVAQLAQSLTMTATTPYEQAKAIEGYLRTIPYNDMIQAAPPGADPIEYFLFDIQQGYCDYYATAMAMMLRSLGVPARTASGYAEGMYDEESGLYYVTQVTHTLSNDRYTQRFEAWRNAVGLTDAEPFLDPRAALS